MTLIDRLHATALQMPTLAHYPDIRQDMAAWLRERVPLWIPLITSCLNECGLSEDDPPQGVVDIAASWLIVTESGGVIESFDSSRPFPLRANYDYRLTSFPILSGATSELVSKSRKQIKLKQ